MFVDDILIGSDSNTVIAHVKMLLYEKYRIKDKGVTEEFLSSEIQACARIHAQKVKELWVYGLRTQKVMIE